jgi:hypothetical protein
MKKAYYLLRTIVVSIVFIISAFIIVRRDKYEQIHSNCKA